MSEHYTVLGASGFVGSRIVQMLRNSGLQCYVPSRDEKAAIFNTNLGRVFYCVGLTADYAQRPFDTVEAHVSFLSKLLENATFDRLVYLSSTRLYDCLDVEHSVESMDLVLNSSNPRNIYDLSKALGENLCITASHRRASVARLSCVYDCEKNSPGFLSELLQQLSQSREFTLDSSSGYSRDYIALDDVVKTLKIILDSGQSEIFNVASGENLTNRQIIDALNASGCKVNIRYHSDDQRLGVCDISKINSLGMTPTLLRDYLQNYLEYLYGSTTS